MVCCCRSLVKAWQQQAYVSNSFLKFLLRLTAYLRFLIGPTHHDALDQRTVHAAVCLAPSAEALCWDADRTFGFAHHLSLTSLSGANILAAAFNTSTGRPRLHT